MELVKALDDYIPTPVRETDKPFLMPIKDIFSLKQRNHRDEPRRGVLKVNDEVEIIGLRPTVKTVVTGINVPEIA